MTVSSLASGSMLSPNHYNGRAYPVSRLTPHHTAGVMTAEQIANVFASTSRGASCNYAIGNDGKIICVVDEDNAAWTSSNYDNDNRAITFEISDCDYDWNISDAAKEAYINLCVDIIQRYGLGSYNWTEDLSGNVTVHRWFAATACPGDPLYNMQYEIMDEVNRRLGGGIGGAMFKDWCRFICDGTQYLYASGKFQHIKDPEDLNVLTAVYGWFNGGGDIPHIMCDAHWIEVLGRYFPANVSVDSAKIATEVSSKVNQASASDVAKAVAKELGTKLAK